MIRVKDLGTVLSIKRHLIESRDSYKGAMTRLKEQENPPDVLIHLYEENVVSLKECINLIQTVIYWLEDPDHPVDQGESE